jgi:acyl-Coa thioesterase superfamily protein/acyl-CoA thioesterase superfamily protein
VADAFFVSRGDLLVPSELTRGPWDPGAQNAGPPAGLVGRALEAHPGAEGTHIGRVTLDILRPIPIAPLRAQVRTLRAGRSAELLEASVSAEDGDELVRASAWRLRTAPLDLPRPPEAERPPPGPDQGLEEPFFPTGPDIGYHTAMEYRFVTGAFLDEGPATVWMRMRGPLVAGEAPSPLCRLLVAADAGNGVSAVLDWRRFVFINTDLTVHMSRLPDGEWVCLDAVTIPEPTGVGLADTALYDERGRIGRATQTLFVRER